MGLFTWLFRADRTKRDDRRAYYAHVCRFLWPRHGFISREHWHKGKLVRVELHPVPMGAPTNTPKAQRLTPEQADQDRKTAAILES